MGGRATSNRPFYIRGSGCFMFESKLFEIVLYPDSSDCSDLKSICDNFAYIKQYAYILHDCDNNKPHYHIMIQCYDTQSSERLARDFGVSDNQVEKSKSKKKTHQYDDMLLYLTHQNAPDKFQYPFENVISNFDYLVFMDKKKNELSSNARKNEIVNLIQEGIIKEYNLTNFITSSEYIKFERVIRSAFSYREKLLKTFSRNMNVIFIHGCSGCGKTAYAKEFCEKKGLDYFISSSSNDLFYGYLGQPCVILDDLRGFSFDFSDFLKLLDNNTNSTVKARYNNKNLVEVQYLIITSSMNLLSFIRSLLNSDNENILQVKRRIGTIIRMDKDFLYVSSWDNTTSSYSDELKFINDISKRYEKSVPDVSVLDMLGLNIDDSISNDFVCVSDDDVKQINLIFGG